MLRGKPMMLGLFRAVQWFLGSCQTIANQSSLIGSYATDLPPVGLSFITRVLGVVKRDPSLDRPGLEFLGFIGAAGRFRR